MLRAELDLGYQRLGLQTKRQRRQESRRLKEEKTVARRPIGALLRVRSRPRFRVRRFSSNDNACSVFVFELQSFNGDITPGEFFLRGQFILSERRTFLSRQIASETTLRCVSIPSTTDPPSRCSLFPQRIASLWSCIRALAEGHPHAVISMALLWTWIPREAKPWISTRELSWALQVVPIPTSSTRLRTRTWRREPMMDLAKATVDRVEAELVQDGLESSSRGFRLAGEATQGTARAEERSPRQPILRHAGALFLEIWRWRS